MNGSAPNEHPLLRMSPAAVAEPLPGSLCGTGKFLKTCVTQLGFRVQHLGFRV